MKKVFLALENEMTEASVNNLILNEQETYSDLLSASHSKGRQQPLTSP